MTSLAPLPTHFRYYWSPCLLIFISHVELIIVVSSRSLLVSPSCSEYILALTSVKLSEVFLIDLSRHYEIVLLYIYICELTSVFYSSEWECVHFSSPIYLLSFFV
jgi:hypothetical protein